jgi:hypothetical protein
MAFFTILKKDGKEYHTFKRVFDMTNYTLFDTVLNLNSGDIFHGEIITWVCTLDKKTPSSWIHLIKRTDSTYNKATYVGNSHFDTIPHRLTLDYIR